MEKWMRLSLALTVLVACSSLALAQEKEQEPQETSVTQAQLPPKVMQTVKEYGKGGEFVGAVKTDEDGVPVYEVTLKSAGKQMMVQTTMDGEFTMLEEPADAKALPKAALDNIAKVMRGAKVIDAEKTLRSVYEVTVQTPNGSKAELLITPTGQLAEPPEEAEDEDKDQGKTEEQGAKKKEAPPKGQKR